MKFFRFESMGKSFATVALTSAMSACGNPDAGAGLSATKSDRTLADDVNGRLESGRINGVSAVNWVDSKASRFEVQTAIGEIWADLNFKILDSNKAGAAFVDVKFAVDHGDFLTSDYSLNLAATNGVTFYKYGNQYRNGPEHQVLYRATVPFAAGQTEVTTTVTIRNLEIKDDKEATFSPVFRIRRNQATATDILGGGPVRYESILDSVVIQ